MMPTNVFISISGEVSVAIYVFPATLTSEQKNTEI